MVGTIQYVVFPDWLLAFRNMYLGIRPCLLKVWQLISFLLFSHSVMFHCLRLHGLQHAKLPCPSPSLGACSNSCPLSWWCHPTSDGEAIVLCRPLLWPLVFPSISVFSNESALCIRQPKYWSFSISPSNEYSFFLAVKNILSSGYVQLSLYLLKVLGCF